MKTLAYFALCAACFAGSYDQAQTGGLTTNGGTISGELIIDADPAAAGGQYSYPLSFLAGSGTNSIYAFDDRLFLLATGQTLNYSNQIVTIGALAQGITNGFKVGSASFQLDSTGALATNWNAGGNIISNATFIGDGSGLTGVSGGGGTTTKSIGGAATDWAWSDSAYIVSRTTGGVTYLEFPLDLGGTVNGVNLVGVDGLSVTQLVIRATASAGAGNVGLLSGYGATLTTNTITLPQYTTNSIQSVSVTHTLSGITNGLFKWGFAPTSAVPGAAGVVWVELFQARGTW